MFTCPATDDFFRARIDHMIDLRHPLAVLASRMPWQEIEARVAQVFSGKGRLGVPMPDLDLFGEQVQRVRLPSNAGRPRLPLRLMISLLYLKHAFNESDEGVVARWAETPRWQFFSPHAYYDDCQPCDASTLIKFRQLLGEEGVEELLAQTIKVALDLKLIQPQQLSRVIVDSTVQHKAIDMVQAIKRQRTIVGRLHREIEPKASVIGAAVKQALGATWHRNWPKSSAATDCIPRISVGYWPKMNKSGTTIYSIAPAQLPRFYKRQHRLQHLS